MKKSPKWINVPVRLFRTLEYGILRFKWFLWNIWGNGRQKWQRKPLLILGQNFHNQYYNTFSRQWAFLVTQNLCIGKQVCVETDAAFLLFLVIIVSLHANWSSTLKSKISWPILLTTGRLGSSGQGWDKIWK